MFYMHSHTAILVRLQYWQLLLELFQFQVVREGGPLSAVASLLLLIVLWLTNLLLLFFFVYVQVCIHV